MDHIRNFCLIATSTTASRHSPTASSRAAGRWKAGSSATRSSTPWTSNGSAGITKTVANLYLAMESGLTVVPVINKIDLPSAEVDRVMEEIDRDLGLDPFESIQVSAKMDTGIDELLEAIVTKLPPPKGDPQAPPRVGLTRGLEG